TTERSWLITYKPTGARVAKAFALPRLREGVAGELVSREYADMDIVKVNGATIAVVPRWSITMKVGLVLAALAAIAAGLWFYMRRRGPEAAVAGASLLPSRITPLSTIAALQRAARGASEEQRRAIAGEIASLERAYFGPEANGTPPDESGMRAVLEKWVVGHR